MRYSRWWCFRWGPCCQTRLRLYGRCLTGARRTPKEPSEGPALPFSLSPPENVTLRNASESEWQMMIVVAGREYRHHVTIFQRGALLPISLASRMNSRRRHNMLAMNIRRKCSRSTRPNYGSDHSSSNDRRLPDFLTGEDPNTASSRCAPDPF